MQENLYVDPSEDDRYILINHEEAVPSNEKTKSLESGESRKRNNSTIETKIT